MAASLIENLANVPDDKQQEHFSVCPGVVTNNIDLIAEGRVQVRVPSRPSFEPWARLPAVGGAGGRGLMWIPQVGDEVLLAFAEGDLSCAYILGGLWSSMKRPPATLLPDFQSKKMIKTGLTEAVGHEVVFDDAEQSVTITTSTKQKLVMDPTKIELSNLAGSVKITLDNASQEVSITALNKISLKSLAIELNAPSIDLKGAKVSVTATGPVSVTGLPIKLN
jgi:uncharacterized protein involved in type VI secretion and phage assembly